MSGANRYVGTELELFESARNWKAYWTSKVLKYISGAVLEIGSGIGANTRAIAPRVQFSRWVCLEPDFILASKSKVALEEADDIRVVCGKIDCVSLPARFDSILYFDVLEHISDDIGELRNACECLAVGGHLVVVSPAHDFLYSLFDRQIGHVRRYDKKRLREIGPEGAHLVELFYLDGIGMLASFANKMLLRQSMPSYGQILFWDRIVVSISRVIDPLLLYSLGKTIVCIWRKDTAASPHDLRR